MSLQLNGLVEILNHTSSMWSGIVAQQSDTITKHCLVLQGRAQFFNVLPFDCFVCGFEIHQSDNFSKQRSHDFACITGPFEFSPCRREVHFHAFKLQNQISKKVRSSIVENLYSARFTLFSVSPQSLFCDAFFCH